MVKLAELQAVEAYYRSEMLGDATLKSHYNRFKRNRPDLVLSLSKFHNLSRTIGLRYKTVCKSSYDDNALICPRQFYMHKITEYINDKAYIVCFFDVSGLSEDAFKKKQWVLRHYKTNVKKLFTYNLTHILCVMTNQGDVLYEYIKGNLNNLDLVHFLKHAINRLRQKYDNKQLLLVVDNARMHRTQYFKSFCRYENIDLLYTAPRSPMLNPIEYLFRFLKTELRKIHTAQ